MMAVAHNMYGNVLNIYGNLERKSHINHGYMSFPYGVKWSHLQPFGQHFGVFTTIEHNLWTLRSNSAISDYIVCCQVNPDRATNIGSWKHSQEAKFMGPTWGPPGSCRSQMGPMLAPWTFLSELLLYNMETSFCLVNTFAATELATQESRPSAAKLLTRWPEYSGQNILLKAQGSK